MQEGGTAFLGWNSNGVTSRDHATFQIKCAKRSRQLGLRRAPADAASVEHKYFPGGFIETGLSFLLVFGSTWFAPSTNTAEKPDPVPYAATLTTSRSADTWKPSQDNSPVRPRTRSTAPDASTSAIHLFSGTWIPPDWTHEARREQQRFMGPSRSGLGTRRMLRKFLTRDLESA